MSEFDRVKLALGMLRYGSDLTLCRLENSSPAGVETLLTLSTLLDLMNLSLSVISALFDLLSSLLLFNVLTLRTHLCPSLGGTCGVGHVSWRVSV